MEEDDRLDDRTLASELMAFVGYARFRHRQGNRVLGHQGAPGGACVPACDPGCLLLRGERLELEIKRRGYCLMQRLTIVLPKEGIRPMKIAFDVGGVLSKYPHVFKPLLEHLHQYTGIEVFVISDMHPVQKIIDMLELNGVHFYKHKVHSADYDRYGELCKTVLCEELGIDILIDDFAGYVAAGKHVRLLVMPDPEEPYYHDDWKGLPGDPLFGRRRPGKRPVQAPASDRERKESLAQRDEVKPSTEDPGGPDTGTTIA